MHSAVRNRSRFGGHKACLITRVVRQRAPIRFPHGLNGHVVFEHVAQVGLYQLSNSTEMELTMPPYPKPPPVDPRV